MMRAFLLISAFSLLLSSLPSLTQCAGLPFALLTSDAGYPPRQNAQVALLNTPQTYFDLQLQKNVTLPINSWLLYGGEFDCTTDVWISPASDHTSWSLISGFTSYSDCLGPFIVSEYPMAAYSAAPGRMHAVDQFNGLTFYMGGYSKTTPNTMLNDVWQAGPVDHINWRLLSSKSTFTPRAMGGAVHIFNKKDLTSNLYVIAGTSADGLLNDVWKSTDGGLSWTVQSDSAPFLPRRDTLVAGYYDKSSASTRLFVIGGMTRNDSSPYEESVGRDVWTSSNGVTWKQLSDAPFIPRARSAVMTTGDGVILVVGGATTVSHGQWDSWVMLNEIWVTFDGAVTWKNCTADGGFSGREFASLVTDESGHLYVIGGLETWPSFGLADIWKSSISVENTTELKKICGVKVEEEMKEVDVQEEVKQENTQGGGRLRRLEKMLAKSQTAQTD